VKPRHELAKDDASNDAKADHTSSYPSAPIAARKPSRSSAPHEMLVGKRLRQLSKCRRVLAVFFPFPCLAAFANEEPHDGERCHRVHPPRADKELRKERSDHNQGEPATRKALDSIGPKGPATELISNLELPACEEIHDRHGKPTHDEPWKRELGALLHPQLPAGSSNDIHSEHEKQGAANTEVGTGQGSVISPLLANIYMHYVLDLWAHRWRRREAQGDMIIVRYADDFVIGFEYEADARRFWDALRERLEEFALSLHPDKTRLIEFGRFAAVGRAKAGLGKPETFNFLGYVFSALMLCPTLMRLPVAGRLRGGLC
jgi:hypothetical protein